VNAPKKPQSAYFLFANDRRPRLREAHPDKKITDVAKMLGEEWKKMPEAEKKPWDEMAKKKKAQYDKEIEEYKKTDDFRTYQKKVKMEKEKEKEKETSEGESDGSSNSGTDSSGEEGSSDESD